LIITLCVINYIKYTSYGPENSQAAASAILPFSTDSTYPTPNSVSSTHVQPTATVYKYNITDDAWTNHNISECCPYHTIASTVLTHFSIHNIQGQKPLTVPSKVPYLQDLLRALNQLFGGLTETWLREHLDTEVNIEGYSLFRQDLQWNKKKGRASGGVAFYIRYDIAVNTQTVLQYTVGVVYILGLYVKAKNLLIINLYRQPDVEFGYVLGIIKVTLTSRDKELQVMNNP